MQDRNDGDREANATDDIAVDQPVLKGRRVVLRPLSSTEARELAHAIAADAEANPWWGSDAEKIEHWLTDPESTVFAIEDGGELAGLIQYGEEEDPDYRYASIDISLLTPWLGRGLGTEALYVLARYLTEQRGHHRLHIDPACSNTRAIASYAKVGFKPVGVLRRYERAPDGTWRDGLLMDLLAEELVDPGLGRPSS